MKKNIVINLGNKGVILSVYKNNKILDDTFISDLNKDTLQTVVDFFEKHKHYSAYIVLDTVAQNYNYKIFPPLNYFDLMKVVERRFTVEIPKSDLKQKKFLYKNNIDKKSVFLFISASVDSPLKEWLNFFKNIENSLLGIYMLPLETVDFAKLIMISSGFKNKVKEKDRWILITFNDRVSDLRQVAIFNNKIAFTRLISVDMVNNNLIEFTKHDIARTSEYIKRFDPDFSFEKLTMINILDKQNVESLKQLKIEKTLILNYTPFNIAGLLKLGSGKINVDERYTDLLLSMFIMKNKKRTRFGNFRINTIYNMSTLFDIFLKATWLLVFIFCCALVVFMLFNLSFDQQISNLKKKIEDNEVILQNKSEEQFGMDSAEVDKIIDAGTLKDNFDRLIVKPLPDFDKFSKAQQTDALTHDFKWTLENFDYQSSFNKPINAKITYNISIINPDGDANKLFRRYDAFSGNLRKTYGDSLKSLTTLPNNINFSKKYLTYPITVEIMEQKANDDK